MIAINGIVSELTKKILQVNAKLRDKMIDSKICPVEKINPSPITEKYRNKCEYSIGYHPDTNERMVGFRASSYKLGSVAIGM
jgi:tRNA (uracil-5-)-methyltransferase